MSRHVRITLEGVATCDEGGQILRTRMGGEGGPLVLISQAWPGVTVEDVTPPRTWTDGDVVQHEAGNYTGQRHDGKWFTTRSGRSTGAGWATDEQVSNWLTLGKLIVLRYQAGE